MDKRARLQKLIESEEEVEVVRIKDKIFRTGFCNQCGACCKTISMNTRGPAVAKEWIELHNVNVKVLGAVVQDSRERAKEFTLSLTFPCQCRELELDNTGTKHVCNIYTDRPVICRMYPKTPSSHKTCTYVFLDYNDLNWFTNRYTKYWREQHGQEKKIKLIN